MSRNMSNPHEHRMTEPTKTGREARHVLRQMRAPWAVIARRAGCLLATMPTWPVPPLRAQIDEARAIARYLAACAGHDPDAGRFLL